MSGKNFSIHLRSPRNPNLDAAILFLAIRRIIVGNRDRFAEAAHGTGFDATLGEGCSDRACAALGKLKVRRVVATTVRETNEHQPVGLN